MDTKHPTYIKINNTFDRVMDEISKFEKVFQPGGKLEQAILEIDGNPSSLSSIVLALSEAHNALREGSQDALDHIDYPDESTKIESNITEGVLDGDDDDGFMARSQLYFLARDAITLHGAIDDRDDLQPWVQSKIAQASKDIDAVRRYTEYNAVDAESSMPHSHDEEIPMVADEPEMPQEMNEGTMRGGLMKYDGQPEGEYEDAVARYKEFMSQPRPPSEATTDMVQGFVFDDELLDSLGEAEDGGDVLDVRYIVQSRLEDFFGPDFELSSRVHEGTWAMPENEDDVKVLTTLMQEPILVGEDGDNASNVMYNILGDDELFDEFVDMAHTMGPDTDARPAIENRLKELGLMEGMNFNEKRTDDLQVIAKDLFKNALANAKKKSKTTKVSEGYKIRNKESGYGVADATYKTRDEAKDAAIMKQASNGGEWEVIEEGNAPEPRKMQVTDADKDAKTPAWKRFKAGDPAYEYKKLKPKTISGDN